VRVFGGLSVLDNVRIALLPPRVQSPWHAWRYFGRRGCGDMHAADLGEMHDKLATFFMGWMGGPSRYTERFGGVNMPLAHMPFAIGQDEVEGWLACMRRALQDVAPAEPADFVELLMTRMRQMAEMLRNR